MYHLEIVNGYENELLGTVILSPDVLPSILSLTPKIEFTQPKNQKIWKAILRLYDQDIAIDLPEITRHVSSDVSAVYVTDVVEVGVSKQKVPYLASKVCEFTKRRKLKKYSQELTRLLETPDSSENDVLKTFQEIGDLLSQDISGGEIIATSDIVDETMSRILRESEEDRTGLDTGFGYLNRIFKGGFKNGNLYVLAGITSHGKTALALNFVGKIAVKNKIPVLFITLELSPLELAERLFYLISNVKNDLPDDYEFEDTNEGKAISLTAGELAEAPLYFLRYADIHISDLRSKLREAIKLYGIKFVIVDHLLKVEGGNAMDTRARQVSTVTDGLHKIAREFDIPVLALCQLNRKASNEDRHPRLSDLKDSSSIEQDAQVVMFVHRDRNDIGELCSDAILKVDKNFCGKTAVIPMTYRGEYFRFREEDSKHED